jgi:hypothetical protein
MSEPKQPKQKPYQIEDADAFDRVLKRFGAVQKRDFNPKSESDVEALKRLAITLMRSKVNSQVIEAREAFSYIVRIFDGRFSLVTEVAKHHVRVCDRILRGEDLPGDTQTVTKEEALGSIGTIERTETHE